jgi:hypothetical protein
MNSTNRTCSSRREFEEDYINGFDRTRRLRLNNYDLAIARDLTTRYFSPENSDDERKYLDQ